VASGSIQCLHCRRTIRKCACKWEADHKARIIITLPRDPTTGRYPQITKTTTGTKKTVQNECRRMLNQHEHDTHTPNKQTVNDLFAQWLPHIAARGRATTTLYNYRNRINRDILPRIGHIELRRLTVRDLDHIYTAMARQPRGGSPASIRQVHAIISAALNYAVKRDLVDRNIATKADIPEIPPKRLTPPTPEQVMVILDTAMTLDRDLGVALRIAATTGARRGSTVAVRYNHLDFTDRHIIIERSIAAIPGHPLEDKGLKAGRGGPVPVDTDTMRIIEEHIAYRHQLATTAGTQLVDDPYLTSSRADCATPHRPDWLTAGFEKVRRQVGLEGVRLHDLRHFTATQLMIAYDPVTVANRLHHSSAKLTLDTYSHVVDQAARAAGDAMGEVLRTKQSAPD
jgi:integrase